MNMHFIFLSFMTCLMPIITDLDSFEIHPSSLNITEGNTTELHCVTGKSAPKPIVHWEKDGQRFTDGVIDTGRYGTLGPGIVILLDLIHKPCSVHISYVIFCQLRIVPCQESGRASRNSHMTPHPGQLLLYHLMSQGECNWPRIFVSKMIFHIEQFFS